MLNNETPQVQAYRWHTITVKGRDCHTGTTDFSNRSDAMLAAAKMILHSHRLATKHSCLASTGILTLQPGSTNTVPGTVCFSLDIRTGEDTRLMRMEEEMKKDFARIADGQDVGGLNEGGIQGRGCTVEWRLNAPSSAIKFDEDCIRCVEDSARGLFGTDAESLMQRMTSGAGHDRQVIVVFYILNALLIYFVISILLPKSNCCLLLSRIILPLDIDVNFHNPPLSLTLQ